MNYTDATVQDISTPRTVQCYFVRQDTLNAQSLPQNFDANTIAALFTFLKGQTVVTFPSTARLEGFWRDPAQDGVFLQVWDPSFGTLALNDIMPMVVV